MIKKPDPSVLGQNIQPPDAEELGAAVEALGAARPKDPGSAARTIDPETLAAAIAYVQAQASAAKKVDAPRTAPRLRKIILDPHEDIPSNGGLYIGYNGNQFLLPTNRPVLVPQGVVNVLDDAILQVAVRDPDTLRYLTSRPAKRFQYRFTEDDPGRAAA